jgi:hypothetical protein
MDTGITTRGIPEAIEYLKTVGYMSQQKCAGWIAEYIIGDDNHGLKHYPGYKVVSRIAAYGRSFQTDKQRRWFFWAKASGLINPWTNQRTGAMAQAWTSAPAAANSWKISNPTAAAKWTMGNSTQANQPNLVGWRRVSEVVSTNMAGAIRHASSMLAAFLKGQAQ